MKLSKNGSITVDFLFGITLVAGVSFVLIGLCFTMAVVEISQYISFSMARTYFGAHISEQDQIERGAAKFEVLMSQRAMAKVLKGEWFNLKHIQTGDMRSLYPPKSLENDSDTFFGTRLELEAKVLNMRLPLLGSTASDQGYKANLGSYLGREPSFNECMEFTAQRWQRFKDAHPLSVTNNALEQDDSYVSIADNGC